MEAKRQRGRPASYATIKNMHELVAERRSENDENLASDNQHDNLPIVLPHPGMLPNDFPLPHHNVPQG
uniref:hypothetical protein n=1 Tax=Mesorhizobium sp. L-2-11 TaxID=2744521 RepID=UPI00192923D8|nr:hypothetical protein [Mesorhizobium sp. L-2-11]